MATDPFDYAERFRLNPLPSETQPSTEPADDLDRAMDELDQQRRAMLREVPREAGQQGVLGSKLGVPPSEITDIDEAKLALGAQALHDLAQRYSAIGRIVVGDPSAVALSREDTESLGALGTVWDFLKNAPGRLIGAGLARTAGYITSLSNTVEEAGEFLLTPLDTAMAAIADASGLDFLDPTAKLEAAAARREAWQAGWSQTAEGLSERFRGANAVSEGLLAGTESVPLTGLAVLTRDPKLGAGLIGGLIGADAYQQAVGEGMSPARAFSYAVTQGVPEGLFEAAPTGVLLKMTGRGFAPTMGRYLQAELPGEMATTLFQSFSDWVYRNPDKPYGEWVAGLPAEEAQTVLGVLGGGTATVSMMKTGEFAARKLGEFVQQRTDAKVARVEGQFIDRAGQAAQASKLRSENPEKFAELMRAFGEDAGVSTILVPGEAVAAYMQSDDYLGENDPLAPYQQKAVEAAAAGNDIALPVEVALGTLPGTKAWEALKEDMRVTPGGMTPREAKAFEEGMAEIGEELTRRAAEVERGEGKEVAQRERLVTKLQGKLEDAGFTPHQARAQAEVLVNRMQTREARGSTAAEQAVEAFTVRQVLPPELERALAASEQDKIIAAVRGRKKGTTSRSRAAAQELLTLLANQGWKPEQLTDDQLRAAMERLAPKGQTDGRELEHGPAQRAGDGSPRDEGRGTAPLDGAPQVDGATGPDPNLVRVAEDYARANGIEHTRQAVYVEINPEFSARIAQAYEEMEHAPDNPVVAEAYADLIRQTRAQYDALVAAGYAFSFYDDTSDPYAGNPWNAMRDLRANKRMAVYSTRPLVEDAEGQSFGSSDFDPAGNPLLAETGIEWPDQTGQMHPVLANDLFRAVHDAFGHGLEGAGFRARGEENAWQAHARLFTGPALGALTTETRGQNSWLNFGPHGETNRNAPVEETVFADQKTGLMPPWTWQEGIAPAEGTLVVDAEGNPMMMFHGTPNDFERFRTAGGAIWFSETEGLAKGYANQPRRLPGRIIRARIAATNPLEIDRDAETDEQGMISDARTWAKERFGFDLEAHGWERTKGPEAIHTITRSAAFADAAREAGYDAIRIAEGQTMTWGVLQRGSVVAEDNRVLFQEEGLEVVDGKAGWTPERISRLLRQYAVDFDETKTKSYVARISPQQFLDVTTPEDYQQEVRDRAGDLDLDRMADETQTPFLLVNEISAGVFEVVGHEGRHRLTAMAKAGITSVPIVIERRDIGWSDLAGEGSTILLREQHTREIRGARNVLLARMEPLSYANRERIEAEFGRGRVLYHAPDDPRIFQQATVFYSALERAVEGVSANRAPAQQWIATLRKTPGVKEEELEWTGLVEWLEMQKGPVEKDAVLQVLREGGIVLREVVLGEQSRNERSPYLYPAVENALRGARDTDEAVMQLENDGEAYRVLSRNNPELWGDEDHYNENWATDVVNDIYPEGVSQPRFPDWTSSPDAARTSGTYRELLLTLPLGEGSNPERAPDTHWGEHPVVAHTRFMDKEGPNGERILFVEEVQSDWHQKGRDQGYRTKASREQIAEAEKAEEEARAAHARAEVALIEAAEQPLAQYEAAITLGELNERGMETRERLLNYRAAKERLDQFRDPASLSDPDIIRQRYRAGDLLRDVLRDTALYAAIPEYAAAQEAALRLNEAIQNHRNLRSDTGGIPDAPFKKSWPELVMKRVIAWAAANGYDQVAWTTGEQQAERYNLSQAVGALSIARREQGGFFVRAQNARANGILIDNGLAQRQGSASLSDWVIMSEAQINEAFGRDVAERLIEGIGENGRNTLEGDDLRVGGEGMKAFYDRNLVNITNKIVKKYGAKVEPIGVVAGYNSYSGNEIGRSLGIPEGDIGEWWRNLEQSERDRLAEEYLDTRWKQPGFTITPELRAAAANGFPLFQGRARGRILLPGQTDEGAIIELFAARDLSTLLHEVSHLWLEELKADAESVDNEQLRRDWQTVLDWFRQHGYEVKNGVIPTGAHEMFARTGERYFREGKAPSIGLQRAFDTFREWLVAIYRTVTGLRAPITPEIREVFDRLIATDEEIAIAREAQGLQALFNDAASAGMGEDEFANYREQVASARAAAQGKVLEKAMKAVRDREKRLYQERRREALKVIVAEVEDEPLFKALSLLREERMDRGALVEQFGEDVLGRLPSRVPPLYAEGGTSPQIIAERAGFPTAQQMVDALAAAHAEQEAAKAGGDNRPMKNRIVETRADAYMRAEFGDPMTEGQIEAEALAAVNNERQGEVLASEIAALARRTLKRPTPYQVARQWARTRVRQGDYATEASPAAIQRHVRAVARAGREAELAFAQGDHEAAFAAKQRQMLSSALLAEAKIANEEVEAAKRRMDRIARARTMRSVDQDYLEQAHDLLERVDLKDRSQRQIDRRLSFEEWARAREAEGFDVVVPASFAEQIGSTHWTRLPVEQLLGLDAAVTQVIHLGRHKQRLLDRQEAREFAAIKSEIARNAEAIGKKEPKSAFAQPGFFDSIRRGIASADAALLKMETVFDWLDNGDPNGPFNRYVFRPIAEAQGRERDMLADFYDKMKASLEAVSEQTLRSWGDRLVFPDLVDPSTGETLTLARQQVIAMALNWGNEGNRQRLSDGYGFRQLTVERILMDTLTREEWEFVQRTWDIIGELWPEIAGLERRVNGVEPEKIEAVEVVTPHGTFRGGYYPAIYDTNLDRRARQHSEEAEDLFSAKTTKATTRASATKERSESVKRPILLDLGVINRHMGEVIHDITHREAIIQANRILSDPEVLDEVDAVLGREYSDQFRPWLKFIANQWAHERAGNEGIGRFFSKLRANATVVGMGFRFSTMMTQLAGYSNSIEYVGAAPMAEAIAKFSTSAIETTRFVLEKSAEMRHRMDTIDRDINSAMHQMMQPEWQRKGGAALTSAKVFAFHGIGYMDRAVSVPTWMAAYNKALERGADEEQAIYEGDKAVRLSQGSAGAKDLAAVQRGTGKWGEALKWLTMFYSYMSAFYQRQRRLGRDIVRGDATLPAIIARAWWLLVVPPILAELLSGRGPDEDEDWAWWAFRKIVAQSLGPIPLARDLWEPAWDRFNDNPSFGYRFTPAQGAGEAVVNVAGDIGNIAEGEDTKRATRNAMELIGYSTGLVPGQIAASTQFLVDVGYGDQDPDTLGEWFEGITKGKVSED